MSHALRRLLLSALTSIPLLCGATYAYADDAEEEDDTEEVDEDASSVEGGTTITIEGGYSDTDPSAVTIYNTELQPYGVWVTDGRWGTVWVPSATVVGADFAPYQTSGHWELTADDEWLWVSDYSWGYIPFHYGRWVWIDGTGWAWIPGRAYAPAWVVWRTGASGYIGWAPMPPAYYWSGGVYYTCSPPVAAYVFVSTTYVYERNVSTYVYRDKAEVTRAVDGTHQHQASSPHYGPAQPSPQEAHVSAPPTRGAAEPKAMNLAKPPAGLSGGGATSAKKKSAPASKPSGTKSVDAPASTPKVTRTSPKKSTTATTTSKPATTTTTTPVVVSKPARKTTTRSTPTVSTPKHSTPKVVTPRASTTTTSAPKPVSKPVTVTTPKPATSTPAPVVRKSTPSVRRGKR